MPASHDGDGNDDGDDDDDGGDDDDTDNTNNKTNLIQLNNGSCKQVWLHPRKVVLKYFHRLEVYCRHFDFYYESKPSLFCCCCSLWRCCCCFGQ